MKRTRLTVAVVMSVASLSATVAHAQRDQVFDSSGTPTRGTIESMTSDEIVLNLARGGNRSFNTNEIKRVTFTDDPPPLVTARERLAVGQWKDGLTALEQIQVDDSLRNVVRQDIAYYKAYAQTQLALSGEGDRQEAAKALSAFVQDPGKKSFHYYEGSELLGDLATAMGYFTQAVRFYSHLESAPWPEYRLRADVKSAAALTADEKYQEALQRYEKVSGATLVGEDADREKQLALAGKAHCLAETGQPDEGLKIVDSIINNNDSRNNALFARAYNAMGACYRNQDQPRDAILAYLHTDILFYQDGDAHAEALYRLNKLWSQQGRTDRAVKSRTLLMSRYGGSIWAQRLSK